MTSQDFGSKYRSLVWSRQDATPDVILRTALLSPRFHIILDACAAFGLSAVAGQWQALSHEGSLEAKRAAPIVERILRNIEVGFQHAACRHT